ncbi:AfsR/SARP family transcriptional regulator [Streptomyces anandii]|uniref:AfsR/SARP family transcriptional regulator n=1 Tax=Streptomyces anandii TaxID=285454 RepID=UPI001677CD49|nr:BTAD domain-containing putative transcriptional regulator [Streptomyces anandii]GGY04984.1 SARP family transcriptional regulator [Streptomyces anandii JCM 4720]
MVKRSGGRLRLNVLGPFEAWSGTERIRVGGPIHERVLSSLLLDAGQTVPVTRLVQAAWNDTPPATARHQVRKAIADLRRRLPGGNEVIITDGPGYRGIVSDTEADLVEFGAQIREADRALDAGHPSRAVTELRSALSLWRGRALSDSGSDLLENAAVSLEERRVAAAEQFFELRLAAGEAGALVADLRDLIAQHPMRETLRGQLMLALYRSGRQAEALNEYRTVRELLVEELGIDPSGQLSGLYESILRDAPELRLAPAPAVVIEPSPTVEKESSPARCTLPHDLPDFTGRSHELKVLLASMTRRRQKRGPRQIVAIDGMGGSGKTSLAVHAAHRVASEFPDGQFHIDLRGFTRGEPPVAPAFALFQLLRALGVPSERIPEDLEGRSALWRAEAAGRRLLLLLDNVADAAQVLPLLPASPASLIVVTSRARLVDLDGAEWLSVGPMSLDEGTLLVEQVLGEARVSAEPDAGRELVQLCGQLPLALRIVSARLRNRPRWTVQYLVDRLRDETRRLAELSAGDRSVAATLQLSFQVMSEEHRTAFRLLALHPGTDVDAYAAAALLGLNVHAAEATLERLLDVHLLQQPAIGLYRFHDLVRDFAHTLSSPATVRADEAAVRRLLGYYVTATETACAALFPGRERSPASIEPYAGQLPPFATMAQAADWFDQEQASLSAAVHLAARQGLDREAACLTRNVVFRLNSLGRFHEFREVSRVAVAAARRAGDLPLLGLSLSSLGVACWRLGRLDEGLAAAREGRDVAAALGDRRTESHAESTMGLLLTVLGRNSEALPRLQRALELERELDAPRAEAESLSNLSTLYLQWGRYEEAAAAARRALELHRSLNYRDNHVMALTDLAFALTALGAFDQADTHLAAARALCDTSSPPADVALVLALSAAVGEHLAPDTAAAGLAEQALDLAASGASPTRQVKVENLIGRLYLRRGDVARALALHTHAYEIAAAMPYRAEQAGALRGMAAAHAALGDAAAADRLRAQADELVSAMAAPICP